MPHLSIAMHIGPPQGPELAPHAGERRPFARNATSAGAYPSLAKPLLSPTRLPRFSGFGACVDAGGTMHVVRERR